MANSESWDTNCSCPGLHLAEAMVTAETVTNVRTQACDHIDSGDIKKVRILTLSVSEVEDYPGQWEKLELSKPAK